MLDCTCICSFSLMLTHVRKHKHIAPVVMCNERWRFLHYDLLSQANIYLQLFSQMAIRWRAWTQSACRLSLLQMVPLPTFSMIPKPPFQMDRSWMARWSSWRMALLLMFSMCLCQKQVNGFLEEMDSYSYRMNIFETVGCLTGIKQRVVCFTLVYGIVSLHAVMQKTRPKLLLLKECFLCCRRGEFTAGGRTNSSVGRRNNGLHSCSQRSKTCSHDKGFPSLYS